MYTAVGVTHRCCLFGGRPPSATDVVSRGDRSVSLSLFAGPGVVVVLLRVLRVKIAVVLPLLSYKFCWASLSILIDLANSMAFAAPQGKTGWVFVATLLYHSAEPLIVESAVIFRLPSIVSSSSSM